MEEKQKVDIERIWTITLTMDLQYRGDKKPKYDTVILPIMTFADKAVEACKNVYISTGSTIEIFEAEDLEDV